MEKILTSFLCCIFLSFSLLAQQSLQFEYGTSRGTQKKARSLSLSWYRNDALKSGHVIRINYDKSVSDNIQEIKSKSLQMDVAKRWHNSLDKKVKLYLEGGISGMLIRSQNQYDQTQLFGNPTEPDCVFCLSGENFILLPQDFIFTEENSLLLYNRKDRPYALNIMPGLTLGGGMDVQLTNSFYMGLHYRLNTYYWIGENEWLFYLRSGLNAGFRF